MKNPQNLPLPGSIINVQAYKFNGMLYRQWNGVKVLRNTDKHFVLCMHKTKVSEKFKHNWIYKDYVLWFMPKQGMYNALILLKPVQNYIYVNIASPPIFEDNTLKFIDLDLDVKAYPHNGASIVDGDEFKSNAYLYEYSKDLKEMVWEAATEVMGKYSNDEYFFNNQVINYYIGIAKKDKAIAENFRANIRPTYRWKSYFSEDDEDQEL
ncbi:DUF402 domain-containing protein [Mycoplasmopsis felifaucium]|uniref:DUF402 domain-containing protein n=1 Tax=Mycoplasmopsis felifaucium TaxID=35768 RepID=A0ABZ2RQ04_9BACT